MNRITMVSNTLTELRSAIEQAEQLASKPSLNPQEVRLHATLLAKISLLKQGVTPDELRRAEMERLAQIVGQESPEAIRGRKIENAELRDWHDFMKYGEKRTDYQSTSQWGRPSGETYDGGSGTGSQGGVLVPAGFQDRLFASMATYDQIIAPENSNVWESDNGAAATTPAVDDVDTTASPVVFKVSTRVDETVQSTTKPVPFKAVQWSKTPTYRTGIVLVAYEIEQDSFEPWVKMLETVFAQRHALGYGAECITGAGTAASGGSSTVPFGLVPAIQSGSKITSASSTLALSDLEDLYHKLGKVYRADAKFYCSDNTAKLITKLLETANRNAYKDDVSVLLDHEIVTCNSMNDWTAGAADAVVFTNPTYLLQRRVKNGSYVKRYTQLPNYVEAGLFGYEGFMRADFRPCLFDSKFPPVASLSAHA